jgi:hypothetical protein
MADRFWVNGTGAWNLSNTTNWSATPGGLGGASVPTSGDNVYFDANSGGGTCTVITNTANCNNLSFRGLSGTSDYSGTFTLNVSLNISGGLIFAPTSSMTIGASASTITFNGAGSFNITYNGQSNTSALTFNNASGNWTFTDVVTQQRQIILTSGNLTFSANANLTTLTKTSSGTLTLSTTITYSSTLTNSAGILNILGNVSGVTLNISGGTVNINGTATVVTTGSVNLSAGTLNINSPNVNLADAPNIAIILSSTGSLNINNDTTTRRVSVTGGTAFTIASGKTLTLTGGYTGAGTPTPNTGSITFEIFNTPTTTSFANSIIKFVNTTSGYATFAGNNLTYGTIWFSRGASTGQNRITGSNTISNLIDNGTGAHQLVFGAGWNGSSYTTGGTQTITTVFNVNGSGSNKRIILNSIAGTGATAFNLNYTGSGVIECDFLDIRNSNGLPNTSPKTWNAYGSVTGGSPVTVTGWFIDNARYWIGGTLTSGAYLWSNTSNWSTTTGGSPSGDIPTTSISAIFDENSGTDLVTITNGAVCSRFYCTPFGGTFVGSNSLSVYSDVILGPSFSSFTNTLIIRPTSGKISYVNTNNTPLACTINFPGGGSVILKSNLNTTSFISHSLGTFDTKFGSTSYDVTAAYYSNNQNNTTTLNMNASTFTMTSKSSGTFPSSGPFCWFASNNLFTLNAGTSSIVITDSTNADIVFAGGGKTYNLVHFNRGGSSGIIGAFAFTPATIGNTYNEFRDTGTAAHSIQWSTLGQTFNIFNVNGASPSARITLNKQSGQGNYSFVSNSGASYCENINVNDCTATPPKKFYANTSNSTIGPTTTGWNNSGGGGLMLLGVG